MAAGSTGRPGAAPLYVVGVPGPVGGAATKLAHLVRLLARDFRITVLAPQLQALKDHAVRSTLEPLRIPCVPLKQAPKRLEGVALGVCDPDFFAAGRAKDLKSRGLRLAWSNEMMFPFRGEAEAVKEGLIDRVLFVSEFQAKAFADMYQGVPSFITGNYIDPDDYCWRERRNTVFTLGRLSRADATKYPLDFPVFYEAVKPGRTKFRVMAWDQALKRQYRWHRFGPEWDLLNANSQSALKFLYTLDVFLYPLGHRVKESWGRAVVEAMLTGAVPVVPAGHQFHKFITHGETGFICKQFREFKECVRELYENYPLRVKISRQGAEYAREQLCNPEKHRQVWLEALTF